MQTVIFDRVHEALNVVGLLTLCSSLGCVGGGKNSSDAREKQNSENE
jgi:hypothetical protein